MDLWFATFRRRMNLLWFSENNVSELTLEVTADTIRVRIFLCLNCWVVKIFCLWICVRLTEPEALVCDVNTKETLSKIRQIHFILFFLVVLKRCFKTDKYFGDISKVSLLWYLSWEQNDLYKLGIWNKSFLWKRVS
jgi:hypothetical protein